MWIDELASGASSRFTFSRASDQLPHWSPDGKTVTFSSNRENHFSVYERTSDGSRPEHPLADLGVQQAGIWDWSSDGRFWLLMKNYELWYMSSSGHDPKPFVRVNGAIRNAQFSPDGKWVAYSSNESGSWEVYVSSFPNAVSKWQVSRDGGEEPRWRGDGKELFYLSSDRKLTAVAVTAGDTFEAGSAEPLFQTHARQSVSVMDAFSYDVTPDGRKFLVNTRVDDPSAVPPTVVLNWASELEK